jgi:DNA-binding CsgD family transcriptional regulator
MSINLEPANGATMLKGPCLSVVDVRSREDYRDVVVRFAKDSGFDFVSATVVVDHVVGDSEFLGVHNAPAGYMKFFDDLSIGRRSPVMQHCKKNTIPLIWDRSTFAVGNVVELWEEQARFGYKAGIALALHLPEGRHFMLGVDRDQPLPADSAELSRMVADVQLFAVHAMDAAMRVIVPERHRPDRPSLTVREVECLGRTMDGKTAWEVGAILGITERTVVLHLQTAMRKLDCINKHQAVLKALRLGLLR